MLTWFLSVAFAGGATQIVVDGEIIAVHHGQYCSYPRLAGVTTEAERPLPESALDHLFDATALTKGFSGIVRVEDELAVGAKTLDVQGDVRRPDRTPGAWDALLAPCRIVTLEGASLPELLRKSGPAARTVLVRFLANQAIGQTSCGPTQRPKVVDAALACAAGKCDDFVNTVSGLQEQRCR